MNKDRLRRTMLFVPGNNPGMIADAHIYGSDAVMFDLEDSVSLPEKDAARMLVYNALKTIDYGNIEIVVRVNPLSTPYGRDDIFAMVHAGCPVIRMPKTESAQDVIDTEACIEEAEKAAGVPVGTTKILTAVESALGITNAYSIATASDRILGIALGAEDYVANLKTTRSAEGTELFYARSAIVVAARAAGIDALDTVYSNVNDTEGLIEQTKLIKQLGFDGKSIINPRQIAPIHNVFRPSDKDIEKAIRIIAASEEAAKRGSGVVALDGKMIDKPIVMRAQRVLTVARAMNLIDEEV